MEHLAPGTRLQHTGGATVTLARRKSDDSGWWNTDGSGLCDAVLTGGDWTVASRPPVDYPALCRQLGEALELWDAGSWQIHEEAQIDAALTAWRAAAAPRESNIGLDVDELAAGTRLVYMRQERYDQLIQLIALEAVAVTMRSHILGAHDGIPGVVVCGCGWEMAESTWRPHLVAALRDFEAKGVDGPRG
jgi:hypothetical protein